MVDPSAADDGSPEVEGADAPFDAVPLGPCVGGDSPLTLQTRYSIASSMLRLLVIYIFLGCEHALPLCGDSMETFQVDKDHMEVRNMCPIENEDLCTGISSQTRTKLRDLAVWQARPAGTLRQHCPQMTQRRCNFFVCEIWRDKPLASRMR